MNIKLKVFLVVLIGSLGLTLIFHKFNSAERARREPAAFTKKMLTDQSASPTVRASSLLASPKFVKIEPPAANDEELQKIYSLQRCYQIQNCSFPETDPRSYELALGHAISAAMLKYWDNNRGDPTARNEISKLARVMILNLDPYVQEACLKIFSGLPLDTENLKATIKGVHGTSDPLLVSQTMSEFKRYLGTPAENLVHIFLADLISRGGQFSSEAAAQNILPFLNESSLSTYKMKLRAMNANTQSYSYLENALNEYARIASGG